jgi:hypothetical protein
VSRSVYRSNVQYTTVEEYYRRSTYIPVLDDTICQLHERFQNHNKLINSLHKILPYHCINVNYNEIEECVHFYFGDDYTAEGEFKIWKTKFIKLPATDRPKSALPSLSICNADFFPTVHFLLKVLATLPVSTATAERTFSTLKRLKTYLRNATGPERLTGMALLSVHRNINVPVGQVIDELAKKPRRLNFTI